MTIKRVYHPDNEDQNVSRETLQKLDQYAKMIRRWTARINLISPRTASDVMGHHIQDCAHVLLANDIPGRWLDLGSGAGLPGLVVAIQNPAMAVTLMEADQRKAVFLREAARQLEIPVTVITQRIESAPPQAAQYVSARALAPLPRLLAYVDRHLAPGGIARLMKGRGWKEEVEDAKKKWNFTYNVRTSRDARGIVLEIKDLRCA